MLRSSFLLVAAIGITAFLSPAPANADDMSDMADWCTKATRPSSVIICSDPELRRMAVIRNKVMGDARAHFSPEDMQEFSRDQNNWIHEYTASCGADTNGPAITPPIKPEIIDCYRRAGRDRVAEMVRAVRDVVPDYKAPVINGNPSQPPPESWQRAPHPIPTLRPAAMSAEVPSAHSADAPIRTACSQAAGTTGRWVRGSRGRRSRRSNRHAAEAVVTL